MSVAKGPRSWSAGLAALVIVWVVGTIGVNEQSAEAQTYTPFSVFDQMSLSELTTLRIKFTSLAGIRDLEPTIVLGTSPAQADMQLFVPFRRPGFNYGFDKYIDPVAPGAQPSSPLFVSMTTQELDQILTAISGLPGVTDGGFDAEGDLSFALLQTGDGTTRCFETIVDSANVTSLLDAIRATVGGNVAASQVLAELACDRDWHGTATPTLLVSDDVELTFRGAKRNRSLGDARFTASVQVTNVSHGTLVPPLILVLACKDPQVDLMNATGRTCVIQPSSSAYITLPVGAGLARNQTVTVPLDFNNPRFSKLDLNWGAAGDYGVWVRVFQGPGER